MANAWDMRPDETSICFAAFRTYLQLGVNRSLVQAAILTPCGKQNAARWSIKFEWIKRIKAWEQFLMETYVAQTTGIMKQNGDQIVSDMLNDYNDLLTMLRIKQAETMARIVSEPDSVSYDELTKLANTRKTIDDLGRRASALPSSFKASDDKPVQTVPNTPRIVGWANPPPKRLASGEEDV